MWGSPTKDVSFQAGQNSCSNVPSKATRCIAVVKRSDSAGSSVLKLLSPQYSQAIQGEDGDKDKDTGFPVLRGVWEGGPDV